MQQEQILAGILSSLQRIESLLAGQAITTRTPALRQPDIDTLTTFLPAVWRAMGSATWCVGDLFEQGTLRDHELGATLRELFGPKPNAKSLGKLLARAAGKPIGGLQLKHCTDIREGVVWSVDTTSRL